MFAQYLALGSLKGQGSDTKLLRVIHLENVLAIFRTSR